MACLNHQSNANQDDNEILLYTYYNGHYKKKQIIASIGEDVEKL